MLLSVVPRSVVTTTAAAREDCQTRDSYGARVAHETSARRRSGESADRYASAGILLAIALSLVVWVVIFALF